MVAPVTRKTPEPLPPLPPLPPVVSPSPPEPASRLPPEPSETIPMVSPGCTKWFPPTSKVVVTSRLAPPELPALPWEVSGSSVWPTASAPFLPGAPAALIQTE